MLLKAYTITSKRNTSTTHTGGKEKVLKMKKYNYFEAVKNDIREYLENEIDLADWEGQRYELEEALNDDLWTVDSVTGNASGSYTFNTWKAEENLAHNLDLLAEALDAFGCDNSYLLNNGAEAADVTIRCYLLSQAIAEVLDELEIE